MTSFIVLIVIALLVITVMGDLSPAMQLAINKKFENKISKYN